MSFNLPAQLNNSFSWSITKASGFRNPFSVTHSRSPHASFLLDSTGNIYTRFYTSFLFCLFVGMCDCVAGASPVSWLFKEALSQKRNQTSVTHQVIRICSNKICFFDTPVVRSDCGENKERKKRMMFWRKALDIRLYGYSNSSRFQRMYILIFPHPFSHNAEGFFPIITPLWRGRDGGPSSSLLMDTKIHFNIFTSMNIFFSFSGK